MTWDELKGLVVETVVSPATAARRVLEIPVPSQAVWLGLALISILNGLYYALLLPRMAQAGVGVPTIVNAPILMTMFILTIFVMMVGLIAVTGQMMGGQGRVDHVARIMVWLQGLRFFAQIAVSILSLVSPLIGWLASLALGLWGVWILLNFVAETHGFSVVKAIGVIVTTFIGVILIMSILAAAFGLTPAIPNGEI